MSEATVSRTIRKVEDVLIRSKQFHQPGKKALRSGDPVIEVVLVDATEQPIERPKKSSVDTRLWVFKESGIGFAENTLCLADKGYQGIMAIRPNSKILVKKHEKHALTVEQRKANRALVREQIYAEHVIRRLKVFRILSELYRNRRKRFQLRFNLIAAVYNLELAPT